MSHRALLAVKQEGSELYDIYYSANGADRLQLTEKLEDNISNGKLNISGLSNEGNQFPKQAQKWADNASENVEMGNITDNAINPQPVYTNVRKDQLGTTIEYDNMEAFYVVNNGTIKTYIPVWMEANILRPLRENAVIEVYNAGKLSSDVKQKHEELEEETPKRVIDEETLTGTEWTDDTIVWDTLLKNHEAIAALQGMNLEKIKELDEDKIPEDGTFESLLQAHGRYMVIKPEITESIFNSQGKGILIRIPNHNTARNTYIRKTANKERMKVGTRLNAPSSEPTKEDIADETKTLFKNLYEEFNDDISPLSPDPFGKFIRMM